MNNTTDTITTAPQQKRSTLSGKRIPVEQVNREAVDLLRILTTVRSRRGLPIFEGVPAKVKANRRAANKAARQSRRINRGK